MTCDKKVAVIILAAGKGTRMRSQLPKVLHPLAGRPMVDHVIAAAAESKADQLCLVIGPEFDAEGLPARQALHPNFVHTTQVERNGTGHAVQIGMEVIADDIDRVIVTYGDIPLLSVGTLRKLADSKAAVSVAVFEAEDPAAYGRIVQDKNGMPRAIVEFKDATEEQRAITLCNGGPIAFEADFLRRALPNLSNDNAQGEYYLTDLLGMAVAENLPTECVLVDEAELAGVNSRLELAQVTQTFQQKRRQEAMLNGVTLDAPESVYFSFDTVLEPDVTVEANVVFGPGVQVESSARIRAFSHLEGAKVSSSAIIGPYARLRPGTEIGEAAKVGNFVEVKNATFEKGAKANHLSYVGDAQVGEKANIGAGTITCNYDGFNKWQTQIGAGAFIGSNSALVAPVKVGKNAIVAAGTTLSKNLDPEALGLTRADQKNVAGLATKFRQQRAEIKRKNTISKSSD